MLGQVRADLARGLQAGHARHRDVHHAQVGLRLQRLLEGVDAVLGLGHDLHVRLALDQQPQAAPHDAVVVGDQDPHVAPMVSSMVVPAPGAEKTSRLPPTSSARSRMPDRPRPPGRPRGAAVDAAGPRPPSKPPPSSRTRSSVRPTNDSSTSTSLRAGVLGDVGQALLRDAVDHELLLVGERRDRRRGGGSGRRMPVRWPKSATWEASAAIRPWSSSAVGRSWRASASSSSIAWVTSCWVSCSSARSP